MGLFVCLTGDSRACQVNQWVIIPIVLTTTLPVKTYRLFKKMDFLKCGNSQLALLNWKENLDKANECWDSPRDTPFFWVYLY